MDQLLSELGLLEVCALQWRMCVERACLVGRQLPPDRYMECRLEEIDENLLRRIMAFCHLEPSPEVFAEFQKTFDPSQPSGRTGKAAPEKVSHVERLIEPTVKWLATSAPTKDF